MAENYELQILDPARMRLFYHGGVLRMTLADDRSYRAVRGYRAFPISDPDHYYGLLDGEGKDIGVIPNPAMLDAESRAAAESEMEKRYFVPVVRKVLDIRDDYGALIWDVETDRGHKRFVVRSMRDNTAELPNHRLLLTDVDGNRFEIADLRALDAKTQEVLLKSM